MGLIGPGKGGDSVGGVGCLADDTSNSWTAKTWARFTLTDVAVSVILLGG